MVPLPPPELEACCELLKAHGYKGKAKEQALKDLDDLEVNLKDFGMGFVPITNLRKALEALPND
jgi:hypothetical protein